MMEVAWNGSIEREWALSQQRAAPPPVRIDGRRGKLGSMKAMEKAMRGQPEKFWTLGQLSTAVGITVTACKGVIARWRRTRVKLETRKCISGRATITAYRLPKDVA